MKSRGVRFHNEVRLLHGVSCSRPTPVRTGEPASSLHLEKLPKRGSLQNRIIKKVRIAAQGRKGYMFLM